MMPPQHATPPSGGADAAQQIAKFLARCLVKVRRLERSVMTYIGSAQLFPSADRLAYVFTPASADLTTICLVVALLWSLATAGAFTSALVIVLLCGHVGWTWLAHTQNMAKLRAKEELITSLTAQKHLLQIKTDKLAGIVGEVADLKASVAVQEAQTADLHLLQSQHDRLEQRVAAMDRMQTAIQAGQKKAAQLPKLQKQLVHLKHKRNLLGRVKWAVQVLKAETSDAAAVKEEYLALKQERADLQETKRMLLELHADAELVSSLEPRRAELRAAATRARTLRAEVEVLEREVSELPGLEARARELRERVRDSRTALKENTNSAGREARGGAGDVPSADKPLRSVDSSSTRTNAAAAPPLPRTAQPLGSKPVVSGGAGVARATGSSMSSAATGGSATAHTPATGVTPPQAVLLDTPHGGSHLFGLVVDNEAFYTPLPNSFATSPLPQPSLSAFTPGPEAAALAAALTAGMPLPSRSGQVSAAGAAAASTAAAGAAGGSDEDDAHYPGTLEGVVSDNSDADHPRATHIAPSLSAGGAHPSLSGALPARSYSGSVSVGGQSQSLGGSMSVSFAGGLPQGLPQGFAGLGVGSKPGLMSEAGAGSVTSKVPVARTSLPSGLPKPPGYISFGSDRL